MPKYRPLKEPETAVDEFFLDDKTIEAEKQRMRKKLGMPQTVTKAQRLTFYDELKIRLYKAGLLYEPEQFVKFIMHVTIIILLVGVLAIGLLGLWYSFPWIIIGLYVVVWILFGFLFFYSLTVIVARLYLDYRMFRRKMAVEKVLPEFLRLVATNYRSGLALDEALIQSNRPRFGVLSKEIEIVSKTAKVRGDLPKALEIFGKKYESKILERAMNNVAMSIRSGSNISNLLEEIADNITKMRNMRSSMAANVKNYIIFIIVAGVIIAPFMFSMSYQMTKTIANVKNSIGDQRQATLQSNTLLSISSGGGMKSSDFDVFAILMLLTNSVVSGFVISMIKYGNYQQGLKRIPAFIVISIVLYVFGKYILSSLLTLV